MVQLGIMVNELITNSIKYAFDDHTDGQIMITLEKEEETYCFTYQDSGKGVEKVEEITEKNSLGIKLIQLTTKQLRGDLQIENLEGLTYTIRFTL
jgi:two-component sensor histidine kinase